VTDTPTGGWARITSARGAELVDTPFDEFHHTADVRRLRGAIGRYGISKLNFHLFRLTPFKVTFATPMTFGEGRFTFDPSGRDASVFAPDQRTNPQNWSPALEWQLPGPLRCRLLGDARYMLTAEQIDDLVIQGLPPAAANELSRVAGIVFRNESRIRETVRSLDESAAILSRFEAVLTGAITHDSPKAHLIPTHIQSDETAVAVATGPDNSASPVEHQGIAAGSLDDWGGNIGGLTPEKVLVIDPVRGRFWFPDTPDTKVWVPIYHYGFSGETGAGSYDRRAALASGGTHIPSPPDDTRPVPHNVAAEAPAAVLEFGARNT
jgi:hypothetical protein